MFWCEENDPLRLAMDVCSYIFNCLMKQDYRVTWMHLQIKTQNSSLHLSTNSGFYVAKSYSQVNKSDFSSIEISL